MRSASVEMFHVTIAFMPIAIEVGIPFGTNSYPCRKNRYIRRMSIERDHHPDIWSSFHVLQLVTISSCFLFCFTINTHSLLYFFFRSFFQPNKIDLLTVLFAISKTQFLCEQLRLLHIFEHFLVSLYNFLYPLVAWLNSRD